MTAPVTSVPMPGECGRCGHPALRMVTRGRARVIEHLNPHLKPCPIPAPAPRGR